MSDDWVADVVHHNERNWKRPDGYLGAIRAGVPPKQALQWRKFRREMTQKGLSRKVAELRN